MAFGTNLFNKMRIRKDSTVVELFRILAKIWMGNYPVGMP